MLSVQLGSDSIIQNHKENGTLLDSRLLLQPCFRKIRWRFLKGD
jgi:hypothetical protein